MSDETKEHPTVDLLIAGISYISSAWPYRTRLADEVLALVSEIAALRARCEAAEAEVDRLSAWPQPQAEEIARLRACVDLNQRGHVHQIEQAVESQNRAIAAEAMIRMLLDVLETVTECEEHRPCGLCRERIRRAVEVKP